MVRTYLLVLHLATVATKVLVPSLDLDTLPVVYMGGTSKERQEENIEMLAKMRYVIINKFEGPCYNECLANQSAGLKCKPSCYGERSQLETLKAVKAVNPKIPGIFYLNTILDFPYLHLHSTFEDADALIHNVDGSLCQLASDGSSSMKHISAFDFSKEVAQQLWLDEVKNLTATGLVDGFYGDTMQIYANENKKSGLWELCKSQHDTCCTMTADTAAKYNAGKNKTMNAAYEFLGHDAVFFKTSDYLCGVVDSYKRTPHGMNATIKKYLAKMPYVHIGPVENPNHDPNTEGNVCSNDEVAAFMLAVEPGAFLGCNGWNENFSKPLGHPVGPAYTAADGAKIRNFSSGTSVVWIDGSHPQGRIYWAGKHPSPSPAIPTPAPVPTPAPAPTPAIQPTANCPVVYQACGWQKNLVGKVSVADWAGCCSACHTHANCDKWAFFKNSTIETCHLHGKRAAHHTNTGSGEVCGTLSNVTPAPDVALLTTRA